MDAVQSVSLTPMQQGLLFHFLRGGRSGVDVVQLVCELPEAVDAAVLRRAWEQVAQRHEGLRAWIDDSGSEVGGQRFADDIELDWQTEDWRGLEGGERERRLEAFLAADRALGFDLRVPPLWRLRLLRFGDSEYRFVWTLHHIVADGRSCQIVLDEVFALAGGGVDELPAAVPSRRYIEWLATRDGAADAEFWRARLAGLTAPTRLTGDRAPDGAGRGSAEVRLSADQTRQLRDAARRHGVTLNNLVQAAWALVLIRNTGTEDVVFGAIRAGRAPALAPEARSVGVFINTVPMRVATRPDADLGSWLREIREQHVAIRNHEQAPLSQVQQWSECGGVPLFDSILIYDHATLESGLRGLDGAWADRRVHHLENTGYPLTVYAYGEERVLLKLGWMREHLGDAAGQRLLQHFENALTGLASVAASRPRDVEVLTPEELARFGRWNDTSRDFSGSADTIVGAFAAQAAARPDATAVICGAVVVTYAEVARRAHALAARLREAGVGRGSRVGLHLERCADLPVAMLGILGAGAAYVPLDPAYPVDRIAGMAEDAGLSLVVTSHRLAHRVSALGRTPLVLEDVKLAEADRAVVGDLDRAGVRPDDPAYVIYTSGSTGRPKGVVVEHGNVVNFLSAMDEWIEAGHDDAWLALTSLSFDISVLELLWPLTRGHRVVVQAGAATSAARPVGFSLFYFASGGDAAGDGYRLLLEGAKFADSHGFEAVWTPERHFHAFGGLYPNPAVAGAAVAAVTERVGIRAGSVVLPLHNPARVVEDWSVVDRLSGGRVGISIASGWHPEDFVFAPDRYADRKNEVFGLLADVQKLWRGESVQQIGPRGPVEVRTMPRPVQPELPMWMTTSGTRSTFERAGAAGLNLLTHLLGQNIEDLQANIRAYREARAAAGFDPDAGRVTLMAHTFVASDDGTAREIVREPMVRYLASAMDLVRNFAGAWTAVSRRGGSAVAADTVLEDLSAEDREALLQFAFERYFETSGLLGSVDKCERMVGELRAAGVDEIACLIDFGVPTEQVLAHLPLLDEVRSRSASQSAVVQPDDPAREIAAHGVTHLQCTPSRARMLLADPHARAALRGLRQLLVGGEALSGGLARELTSATDGRVLNMYGPTETTIWSTVHVVTGQENGEVVPIGRPIANTQVRVTTASGELVPVGVAGELRIGGAGVARGYHGRPDLTADRFTADPVAENGREYRTGDIVRWREDGVLEFLGRGDHQVKIRGHRVELAEVECVLASHPSVREAVVIARPDRSGSMRLLGYAVVDDAKDLDRVADLRAYLARQLPDAMVPSVLTLVNTMPLTPNGKLDRSALPDPGQDVPAHTVEAAGSATEQALIEVWRDVLGADRIGVTDNFFDLGGHSLLTIQLQVRLRERFAREVPITDLFRFPTVRALAAHLDGMDATSGADTGSRRAEMRRARMRRVPQGG
jgi:natural product biosynthesis luciferase-like monooxygenase protein